jgi:hypothetical protein
MQVLIRLFLFVPLVWALGARPALAAWPNDWLFLKSEEGWFFYKEPSTLPQPPQLEPSLDTQPQPDDLPQPAPQAPQMDKEPTKTSTEASPNDLRVAPAGGPQLESWLLAVSDHDLKQMVSTAPAAALRAWIPVLLDQATTVLNRTAVRKYLLVHRETLRRSEKFSKLWQEVIWTDPTFDRPDHLPTGTMAQAIYEQEASFKRTATIAALRERVTLLVVVGPDCAACEAQWKIVQGWTAESGVSVRPIAKELITLGDGTIAMPYPRVIEQLAVAQLPSLYLTEPRSGGLIRLGGGLLTQDEISARILKLVPTDNPQQKGEPQHVSDQTTPRDTTHAYDE